MYHDQHYDAINADQQLIENVCTEEQIAHIERSKAFIPNLEAIARALKEECKINKKDIISLGDLQKIADKINARIVVAAAEHFPTTVDALLVVKRIEKSDKHMCPFIIIKEGIKERSARFRIGHEIGHLVLGHRPLTINEARLTFNGFRKYIRNEYEANHIAGAILIGARRLERAINLKDIVIDDLCTRFDVTYETMAHRIALVSDHIHFIKLSETGKVIKRLAKHTHDVRWSSMRYLCKESCATRLLRSTDGHDECNQVSILYDEANQIVATLYCTSRKFSRRIPCGNEQQYVISLGCRCTKTDKDDHGNYFAYYSTNKETLHAQAKDVMAVNCDSDCPRHNSCDHRA